MTLEQIESILNMKESERIKATNTLNISDLYLLNKVIEAKENAEQKAQLRKILQAAGI